MSKAPTLSTRWCAVLPTPGPARWTRFVYAPLAAASFALGVLGAILPGLPATPFLLLTSFCLVRCSPRLHERLLRSPLCGPLLRDWRERGGLSRETKRRAIAIVAASVALSLAWTGLHAPWTPVVPLAALLGVALILRLPEAKPQ